MASKQKKTVVAPAPRQPEGRGAVQWIMIAGLAVAVAFGVYQFASANSRAATPSAAVAGTAASTSQVPSAQVTGPETPGTAVVAGGVQKISIDVSNVYSPNVINLKAGVPAELTFSGGSGCTVRVQSQALGFDQDMSAGPTTVKLQALQAGTYPFACGMNMVHGRIVVH